MSSNNSDVPENANEECVGPQSEMAGKASSCAGCPNQSLCSSGATQGEDPAIEQIQQAMSIVKHKLLILSGKGGVGKSTFSTQLTLALGLSEKVLQRVRTAASSSNNSSHSSNSNNNNHHHMNNNNNISDDDEDDAFEDESPTQVGILDIDLCGPSVPRMFGLEGQQLHQSNLGWSPAYYQDNVAVISIGFMLPNLDDPVIWRGPKKNGLIKQFLRDVYWGDYLDYLVIDTPPGTSDEHITVVQYLKNAGLDGAVIITTPQDVSCIDVRREISFCKKVGIPILGLVENMSGFVCPKCSHESFIFRPTSGGGEKLAKDTDIPFLGKIPLDPQVMHACETGKSILKEYPSSPASRALLEIVDKLKQPNISSDNNNTSATKDNSNEMQHQIPRSFSKHDNQQWFRQNKPLAIIAAFVATVVFVLIVKSFLSSPPAVPKENVYQTTSEEIQVRERIDPSYYQEPLSWRPRVFRIKNLLSAGECDRLIQMSMGRLTKAEVYNPATSNSATSMASRTIFTGMKTFLRSDETVWLDGRIAQLLHLPYEYGEDFVVRKLSVGDAELKHVDYYAPGESAEVDKMLNRHGNRYATLIMYLNDDYTGGELKFSQAVQPFQIPKMNKGDALLYFNTDTNARLDPLTEHEASPIITGTKWIAVKWLRQKKWKLSEEEIARLNE